MGTDQDGGEAPLLDGRHETPTERLDRNWGELLQELRVTQTGSQLLTAFLLTIPFQARFADLTRSQVVVFLVLVVLACAASGILIAPVAIHRALFRRQLREETVLIGHRLARVGLGVLGVTICGCVGLLFDVAWSRSSGVVAAAFIGVLLLTLWWAVPAWVRERHATSPGD